MKTNLKSLLLLALLMTANFAAVSAKTWRVNPNPDAAAPFHSIVDALASEEVQPGDELLLDPGTYSGGFEISKESITITGPGYGLGENTDWVEARSAILTNTISIKANNVTLQGLDVYIIAYDQAIVDKKLTNINGGIIQRCFIRGYISANYTASNISIRQNYYATSSTSTVLTGSFLNSYFINNIVPTYGGYPRSISLSRSSHMTSHMTIENNIFGHKASISGCTDSYIRNNIFLHASDPLQSYTLQNVLTGGCTTQNNIISNNVFQNIEPDTTFPNNEWTTTEKIFVDELNYDGYFLCEGSPAKGKASDGGDCGIFGGATPYVLSGRPANMPHITSAIIPSSPTNGEITVKLNIAVSND